LLTSTDGLLGGSVAEAGAASDGAAGADTESGGPADAAFDTTDALLDAAQANPDATDGDAGTADAGTADAGKDADASPLPAVHLVQSAPFAFESGATHAAALQDAVTAGNLIVAVMGANTTNSADTFMVGDAVGNVWKAGAHHACIGGSNLRVWYAESAKAGIYPVTLTQSAPPADFGLALFEYAGLVAADALDVEDGACASTTTQGMGTPFVDTRARDFLVAAFVDVCGAGVMTAGTGWTAEDTNNAYFYLFEDRFGGMAGVPPGRYQATARNPNNSSCWVAAVAAFRTK
jgi:hypothetical protein